MEIRHTIAVKNDVFQYCTALSRRAENGGLVFLGEVDEFGVATAFKVEDAVGAPAVLVVTDEGALRIGGKRGLAGAGEAEEDGRVFAVGVGRAVHGENALLGQDEVHHGKDGFLDFTSVAGAADDDFLGSVIDDDETLGIEPVALGVGFEVRCMENGKFGLVLGQLFSAGPNEHVSSEGVVPGVVVDHADGKGFGKVGAAVQILDEERALLGQEIDDLCSHAGEGVHVGGDVDVAPVDVVGDRRLVNDVLVVGRAAGSLTGFGDQRPVGAQDAFSTLDGQVDECCCLEVPVDITAGGDAVQIEATGGGGVGAAHVGRLRRPSLSLLAHQQLVRGVQGRC